MFDANSYRNVLCLGHILAEDGRKMSKHLGNILEPIPLMDAHGADAVRWFAAAGGSPWARRAGRHSTIHRPARKVFLTFWEHRGRLGLGMPGQPGAPTGRPCRRPPRVDLVAGGPRGPRWSARSRRRWTRSTRSGPVP